MRFGCVVTCAALGVGTPLVARANDASARSFSLVYAAPVACPSRAAFVAAIAERAPAAVEGSPAEASVAVAVELEATGTLFSGSLWVRLGEAPATRRDVPAAPCEEVTASIAVMVAMILESRATATPEPAPAAQTAATPPAADRPEREPGAARARTPTRETPRTEGASAALVLGASAGGLFESGAAPAPHLGWTAGADVWLDRRSFFSPSARISFVYVARDVEADGGDAGFRWMAARLSACPLRWPADGAAFGRLCAELDGGELRAQGENVPNRRTQRMPWLAAGLAARGELPIAPFLSLEAALAARAPSRHDDFVLEPERESVHDVPRISVGITLGLTGRLPRR